VELDAVEARPDRALGGIAEQFRQHARELRDVRHVHVGDALAKAALEIIELAWRQHVRELRVGQRGDPRAQIVVTTVVTERRAMGVGELEKAREIFLALGSTTDRKKIDQLDEQECLAAGRFFDGGGELLEAGHEPIVTDPQQRPRCDIANAGRLDDDHAGSTLRESRIPIDHVFGDEAVVGRAPRHHRRHPRARPRESRPDHERLKQACLGRLLGGRPRARRQLVLDPLGGLPHRVEFVPRTTRTGRARRSGP